LRGPMYKISLENRLERKNHKQMWLIIEE